MTRVRFSMGLLASAIVMTAALALTGCAGNQKFDCPYSGGIRCQPLGEVDKQIDSGTLNQEKIAKKPFKKLEPKQVPTSMLRTEEEVLSVWVAPYQTEDGTYHEEKIMHFVARPAEWVVANEVNLGQN